MRTAIAVYRITATAVLAEVAIRTYVDFDVQHFPEKLREVYGVT